MWPFKKKLVQKPNPRVVLVPENNIEALLKMYDNFLDSQENEQYLRYTLWTYARKTCPEISSGDTKWRLDTSYAHQPRFVEILGAQE